MNKRAFSWLTFAIAALFVQTWACPAEQGKGTLSQGPDWFLGGVIYELNPLVMSESGRLADVTERLAEIRELGVNAIYVMPIFEHEPLLTYRIYDYYKIAPEVGTPEDLHAFVRRAHELGMRVLLDLVIAHSPAGFEIIKWPDEVASVFSHAQGPIGRMFLEAQRSVQERLAKLKDSDPAEYEQAVTRNALLSFSPLGSTKPQWFLRDGAGKPVLTYPNPGWGLAFDYGNPEVHKYFADIASYYVREFDIDGWRVDAPQNNFDPKIFPNASNSLELLRAVSASIKSVKPDAILFAENVWADGGFGKEGAPVFDEVCEISYWHWLRWEMAQRRKDKRDFSDFTGKDLAGLVSKGAPTHGRRRAIHVGTHDTERVREMWPEAWRALTILHYTLPGAPMIYGGAEIGETDRFFVHWDRSDEAIRKFHIALGRLLDEDGLRHGDFTPIAPQRQGVATPCLFVPVGEPVCGFVRTTEKQLAVIIVNFGKADAHVTVSVPTERLKAASSVRYLVLNGLSGDKQTLSQDELSSLAVTVLPGDGVILLVTTQG